MINFDELGPSNYSWFRRRENTDFRKYPVGNPRGRCIGSVGDLAGQRAETVPKGKQVIQRLSLAGSISTLGITWERKNEHFAPYIGMIFSFILVGSSLGLLDFARQPRI